jgi:hypothetical protein
MIALGRGKLLLAQDAGDLGPFHQFQTGFLREFGGEQVGIDLRCGVIGKDGEARSDA